MTKQDNTAETQNHPKISGDEVPSWLREYDVVSVEKSQQFGVLYFNLEFSDGQRLLYRTPDPNWGYRDNWDLKTDVIGWIQRERVIPFTS